MLMRSENDGAEIGAFGIHADARGQPAFGAVPPKEYESFLREADAGGRVMFRVEVSAAQYARVLGVLRNWERDAVFLVGQILGPWFDLLLPLPPFSREVQQGLVEVARSIPSRVALAEENLARAGVADLARVAALELQGMRERFPASVAALDGFVDADVMDQLREAAPAAGEALASA